MYSITYKRLENKTILHIDGMRMLNKDFCSTHPYLININLGEDIRCLLCDGEYIIDITHWSGVGLTFSTEILPSFSVRELVEDYIFNI